MEAIDPGPLGEVEKKLPIIGKAIAGAIQKLSPEDPNRFVFALFVIDTDSGVICWTSDGEREGFRAALQEFLTKQAH